MPLFYREKKNECCKPAVRDRSCDGLGKKTGEVIVVDFKFGKKKLIKKKREEKTYNMQDERIYGFISELGYELIRGYLWYVFNKRTGGMEGNRINGKHFGNGRQPTFYINHTEGNLAHTAVVFTNIRAGLFFNE